MNEMDTKKIANQSAFRMIIDGSPVLVEFSKTESVGLKDTVRDTLTKVLEEKHLKSVELDSKE